MSNSSLEFFASVRQLASLIYPLNYFPSTGHPAQGGGQ